MTFDIHIRIDESLEVISISGAEYYKGDKGDDFTYEDFTPEQIESLKQPAIDAAEEVEALIEVIEGNELSRISAENGRVQAETGRAIAENNRETSELARSQSETTRGQNETTRQQAEITREANEGERITAETERNSAEELRVIAEQNRAAELAAKANHGYTTNPKTLKEVEENPFVPIQMPAFYVYEPAKFRVQSVKSTHKLSGNFTHIKKYNAQQYAVNSYSFIVKTADGKYSISFYNEGYTTRIIVINNGITIYNLSQASSIWWSNQGVIIQRTIVDFDSEKIIISYGATSFEVSVAGLRAMKNIEFTDIELGINSYISPCAYSILIQGIPASDVDGTKIISNLNTPSTSNLVDSVPPRFELSSTFFNFENGKVTFDYPTLSGLSTTGNTYTQHFYDTNRLFNISNIEQSQQEIFVRYSFDIDVENASVYFKSVTTTTFKRIRLVNRETFAVIDITTNLYNPFEVPVGKWNMVVSTIAKRQYEFGLLLGWAGCNSGAAMTIYQGHSIDPVSVVLSAYPRLANTQKAWCPYSKQFTSEFTADFSNDII